MWGINVSDITLENVAEHKKIIDENIEDKEALEKAYVELSEENPEVWKSPYIYYYLSLIYSDEYEPLFDLKDKEQSGPLEAGLAKFPDDPFLSFEKAKPSPNQTKNFQFYEKITSNRDRLEKENFEKGLAFAESKSKANNIYVQKLKDSLKITEVYNKTYNQYKSIIDNHPGFLLAVDGIVNLFNSYHKTRIKDSIYNIINDERKDEVGEIIKNYENADKSTDYYSFNEIFNDTIAFNTKNSFSSEKQIFESNLNFIQELANQEKINRRNILKCLNNSTWQLEGEVSEYSGAGLDFIQYFSDGTYRRYVNYEYGANVGWQRDTFLWEVGTWKVLQSVNGVNWRDNTQVSTLRHYTKLYFDYDTRRVTRIENLDYVDGEGYDKLVKLYFSTGNCSYASFPGKNVSNRYSDIENPRYIWTEIKAR